MIDVDNKDEINQFSSAMKNSITKKQIDRAITHLDLEICGNRGDGCFYFIHKPSQAQAGETVMVAYLNQFSLERWVSEAESCWGQFLESDEWRWYSYDSNKIQVGEQWLDPKSVPPEFMINGGHLRVLRDFEFRMDQKSFRYGPEWDDLNDKTVTLIPITKQGRVWFRERYGLGIESMEMIDTAAVSQV